MEDQLDMYNKTLSQNTKQGEMKREEKRERGEKKKEGREKGKRKTDAPSHSQRVIRN